ncbi:hypothetical protein Tco_0316551 [Tanacetum coccineum]
MEYDESMLFDDKYILKQQFEGFSVSNSEGLHKGYDRFQSLLSQLEIHGAGVSSEDANQKFIGHLLLPGLNVVIDFNENEIGLKKTGHFARECRTKGNQDNRRRDAWNSGNKDGGEIWYSRRTLKLGGHCWRLCVMVQSLRRRRSYALVALQQLRASKQQRLALPVLSLNKVEDKQFVLIQKVQLCKESDLENQPLDDRFVTTEGMHDVPLPMTGNYMPSGPDIEIEILTINYGPKQFQPRKSETQTSDFDTCESNISVETSEFVPKPTVNEPKVLVLLGEHWGLSTQSFLKNKGIVDSGMFQGIMTGNRLPC